MLLLISLPVINTSSLVTGVKADELGLPGRRQLQKLSSLRGHTVNTHLGNSQLVFLGALFGVRTSIVFTEGNGWIHSGLVNGLEGELCAEKVAHGPQRCAHIRWQRGVCQEVSNEAVGLAHHSNIHSDTGS